MNIEHEVLKVLDEVLHLEGRAAEMNRDSPLLGTIPELDSMSVMGVIAGLEERFEFTATAEELEASSFDTLGTLADFIRSTLGETSISEPSGPAPPGARLYMLGLYTLSMAPMLCAAD